jgi:MFS family permease
MFSVFTGLCAVAQGYWDLLAYRTLAGMGLGGEFGIGMALIAEVWPASKRNRASAWVGIGWQLGVLLAAFITPLLLDIIGWRGMFLVGLLPALVSFAIRRGMGEPDAFTKDIAVTQEVSFTTASGCCLPTAPPRRPVSGSSSSARYRILATTA